MIPLSTQGCQNENLSSRELWRLITCFSFPSSRLLVAFRKLPHDDFKPDVSYRWNTLQLPISLTYVLSLRLCICQHSFSVQMKYHKISRAWMFSEYGRDIEVSVALSRLVLLSAITTRHFLDSELYFLNVFKSLSSQHTLNISLWPFESSHSINRLYVASMSIISGYALNASIISASWNSSFHPNKP